FPYTRFSLKHLATHEVFPGHLVHMNIRENRVADGTMPLDGAQVVTSSASSALFEGIADNGMEFLDWISGPEDELGVALQRLRSAMRCNAAWMMHAQGMSLDEIVPIVANKTLQDPVTMRSRLAFLSHNLRAPFVYAYYGGDMAVNAVWKTVKPEQRKAFWEYLYNNMHTPTTLAKYWQPESPSHFRFSIKTLAARDVEVAGQASDGDCQRQRLHQFIYISRLCHNRKVAIFLRQIAGRISAEKHNRNGPLTEALDQR